MLKQLFVSYTQDTLSPEKLNSHYFYSIFFNVFFHKNIDVLENLVSQLITKKSIKEPQKYTYKNLKNHYAYNPLNSILSKIIYNDETARIEKIFNYCFSVTEDKFLDIIIFSIIKNMGLDETTDISDDEDFSTADEESQNDITENNFIFLDQLKDMGFKTERFKSNDRL